MAEHTVNNIIPLNETYRFMTPWRIPLEVL